MPYMNQEKKKAIAAELKKVVPADWKYTLGLEGDAIITMKIKSAPVDLMDDSNSVKKGCHTGKSYLYISHMHLEYCYSGELLELMNKIMDALYTGFPDYKNNNLRYHEILHYSRIYIGTPVKPFLITKRIKKK